jgi:polyribonucleotide nucleotidyltransferase
VKQLVGTIWADVTQVKEGEMVKVKVLEVDKQGRVRLSMKEVGKDD